MTVTATRTQSNSDAEPRLSIVGALFVAAAFGLLYQTLATRDMPTHAVVWGGLALASYAFGLLCLVGSVQGPDLGLARWSIGSWTMLWCAISFGLATVTWSQPQTGVATEIDVSSVVRALWLVAVGTTVWGMGFFIGPGRPANALASRAMRSLSRTFGQDVRGGVSPWILYGIGLVGRLGGTAVTGRLGYVGDASSAVSTATGYGAILNTISLCAPLAVAAAALRVYRERVPGARVTLIVLGLAELAFGAAAGGKEQFVVTVLAIVMPFSATRHKLPKVVLVVGVLVFMVVVIPFNQAYRTVARNSSATLTPGEAVAAAPAILQQTLTGHNVLDVVPQSFDYLLQRLQEIDSPAIVLQRTPMQTGFLSPVELVSAPIAGLVPRAIWAGKPILATGYQFSQQYYGTQPGQYTSSAVTPVGDLYRHGGWIPVIAGMLVLGAGVRLLDNVLDVRGNPHSMFLVLLLLPSLVKNEADWVTLLAGIPSTVLIWLLAVAVTFRSRRPT